MLSGVRESSPSAVRCGAASGLRAAIAPPGTGCPRRMRTISAGGGSETTGPTGCAAWIAFCAGGGAKSLGGKRHRHCWVGSGGVPEADERHSGLRPAGDEIGPARQALQSRQKARKRLSQSAEGSVNGPQTTWRPGRRLIAGAGVAVGELKRWNGEGAEIASRRAMLTKSPARKRYDSVAGEDASVSASVNVCWELIVFWLLLQRLRKRPAETDGVWGELERSGQRGGRDIPARSMGGVGRCQGTRFWPGDFRSPVSSV